ncbi:MAG TPA: acyl-CoA dehydrogenase family protein [Pyrinomonadaceae bacterium]|nr:acyl-CoA dehydrogenase family protein [Pyrinomonadaceae bacterium]
MLSKPPFSQSPPELGNQYEDDRVLRSYLRRALPPEVLCDIEPELSEMGRLSGGELYRMQLADRLNEPRLTQWDAWGERVDTIEVSPLWKAAQRLAAERGVVATAYERKHGPFSRTHQASLAYLFTPSTDIYSCPLAMTDGAAQTLMRSGNRAMIERVVPHLLAREPEEFWTSGQWMTELTGGSDVGLSETIARRDESGAWRLYGRKWFTSATTSEVALTLARPGGNASGGQGLALFLVETRDDEGRLRHIQINRLKDKLGTRKVPTAELTLEGTPAELVMGTSDGVRNIAPMLNITRLWNGISACALMRRGLALARSYARRRYAFGANLSEKPLHVDTLAGLQAEMEAAFHLAFFVAELVGLDEAGEIRDEQRELLRFLTPVMKLMTARQAVAVTSEALEAFGGAGYVEDTGLPVLLRDAQVLSIWEGTTNVLSLDALRALTRNSSVLAALKNEVTNNLESVRNERLAKARHACREAMAHAEEWLKGAAQDGQTALEAGARRFALSVGRVVALSRLASHAQWSVDEERDARAMASARRFAQAGVDLINEFDVEDARLLMEDE